MENKVKSIEPVVQKAIYDLDNQIKNLENEISVLSDRFDFVLSPVKSISEQADSSDEAAVSPCRRQIVNLTQRVANIRRFVSDFMLRLEI